MYNEKIEALIKAALADGVLTEKEKQVLFRRAQEQGIDLDEFEMVLDARLVELKKSKQTVAPKSNKSDDVKKCPVCGDSIATSIGVCPSCGHVFSKVDNISLLKELRENYQLYCNTKDSSPIIKILKNIACPIVAVLLFILYPFIGVFLMASKTTIKEILSYFRTESGEKKKYATKHKTLMFQIRHTYAMDKDVMKQAEEIDVLFKSDKKKNLIITILSIGILVIIALTIYVICAINLYPKKQFSKLVVMQQYDKAYELVISNPQLVSSGIRDAYIELTSVMIKNEDLEKSTYLMNSIDKVGYYLEQERILNQYFDLCLNKGEIALAVEHIETLEHATQAMLYYINNKQKNKAIFIYNRHKKLFYRYASSVFGDGTYIYKCDNGQITSFLKKNNINLDNKKDL